MTHDTQNTSLLRQRMSDDMTLRKFSPKTQTGYIRVVKNFTQFLGRSPDTATAEDLRSYQLHLVEQGVSSRSLNAKITGLRFFFKITLEHPEAMAKMSHVYEPRKLSIILSLEEVTRLLQEAGGPKYQAALAVTSILCSSSTARLGVSTSLGRTIPNARQLRIKLCQN